MTTTMQLIAKQTVGSGGASSVTFSNIPQTYTDLKVVISARSSYSNLGERWKVQVGNGTVDTGANYSSKSIFTDTPSVYSQSQSYIWGGEGTGADATASTFGNSELYIPNYTSSDQKSMSMDGTAENNGSATINVLTANLWTGTSAINIMTITPNSGTTIQEFSTFYLYGISNNTTTQATTVPYASGGDVITTDGTYWYHAFKYSGTFTPLKALSADVLVVAGGGGGQSGGSGGGGGAGGIFYATSQALLSNTNYTCTVGAGGGTDTPGSNSQFGALTVGVGGGRGGDGSQTLNGGSGGGGYPNVTGGASTQTSTGGTGYGNAGGNGGAFVSPYPSGGGGGAGAVGGNGSGSQSGAGGAGLNTWSSWASATATGASGFYAGGGGGAGNQQYGGTGGAGGSGGGGAGGTSGGTGTAGTANTGGGGGGSSKQPSGAGTGSAGGSGIVIVRYAV